MKLLRNSITMCYALLTIMNTAEGQSPTHIRSGLVRLSNHNVIIGTGVEPDDLPIVEYTNKDDPTKLQCTVHTRNNSECKLTLEADKDTIGTYVHEIRQFAGNKVAIVWRDIAKVIGRTPTFYRTTEYVTTLDTTSCDIKNTFKFLPDVPEDIVKFSFHADGFDTFTYQNGTNSRTSYNSDGNVIDGPKLYSFDLANTTVEPVSKDSRSKVIFLTRSNNNRVNLVDDNGQTTKQLLEFEGYDIVNDVSQSLSTFCWINHNRSSVDSNNTNLPIKCVQFDEFGSEVYKTDESIQSGRFLFDVKNLHGGGVILFTLDHDRTVLNAIEMRPHHQTKSQSFYMNTGEYPKKVANLDDVKRTFAVVYQSDEDGPTVFLREYSFP